MKNLRRLIAALLAMLLLVSSFALGEEVEVNLDDTIAPEIAEVALAEDVIEEVSAEEAVAEPAQADEASEDIEDAPQEVELDFIDGVLIPKGDDAPEAHSYDVTIDPAAKAQTMTISVGDTVRVRVSGAEVTAWKPGKNGVVSYTSGSDEFGAFTDFHADAECKKLSLKATITGHKKKNATLNLIINNPFVPASIDFNSSMPTSVPVGTSIKLPDMVTTTPSYAVTTLTYKVSGAGKVSKDGTLTTTKAGNAKITVTAANNKKAKATFSLQVQANKLQKMNPKPAAGDFAAIAGGWTLWPLSVEVAAKGLNCQFYLLNATGEKVTKLENMELTLAVGTRSNIVARYSAGKAISASVGNNKSKAIKLTMTPVNMDGVFLPEHWQNGTLYFDINQNEAALTSKKGRYSFIPTKFPTGDSEGGNSQEEEEQAYIEALKPESAELTIGENVTLTPVFTRGNNSQPEINWYSENENIATIDHGVVTAVSAGTTWVWASVDGTGNDAYCRIIVKEPVIPATGISLNITEAELDIGDVLKLEANVLPENATNREVVLTSSNEGVARIQDEWDGNVQTVGSGTATITATLESDSSITATCTISVSTLNKSYFRFNNGVVVGYSGPGGNVTIPQKDRFGEQVTGISGAFERNNNVTSVTIPDGIISIGKRAFYCCENLTSISIPDSVTSIGDSAFMECKGLTSISISNNVTSIGDSAFYLCTGLTSVMIPNSVTSIRDGVFCYCTGLTSVTIPNSVTSIGDNVFRGCSGLTSIIIPNSVTSIGDSAFNGCSGLTSVTIPNSITSIGESAFYGCSGLTSVTIPNSVTSIGDSAFYACSGLTSVTIPESITSIGNGTFGACSGLTSVTIPGSITSIGEYAFSYCRRLAKVIIPNSVSKIGKYAFSDCDDLISITIPNSIKSIEEGVFSDCSSLTGITIPNSVSTIGNSAFESCNALTSITIPNSVTSIGDSAFGWCSGLTQITIPDSATSIGNSAFERCYSLTSITIPNSVTTIGNYMFYGCNGLTEFTIPNSVTSIGDSAFDGCYSLVGIVIPDSVKSIGEKAFHNCGKFTEITVPNSVTSVKGHAFEGCYGLVSVKLSSGMTSVGEYIFNGCNQLTRVTIPTSVTNINAAAFMDCDSLVSIAIPASVTSIDDHAFESCDSLTTIIAAPGSYAEQWATSHEYSVQAA